MIIGQIDDNLKYETIEIDLQGIETKKVLLWNFRLLVNIEGEIMEQFMRDYVVLEKSLKEMKENVKKREMSQDTAKYVAQKNLETLKHSRLLALINNSKSDIETKSRTMALVEKFDKLEEKYQDFISLLDSKTSQI